jgi:hypothetical protein
VSVAVAVSGLPACLPAATVAARNKFPWAKVPVAKIIAKAYEMRYTFAMPESKAQVERWQRMVVASNAR